MKPMKVTFTLHTDESEDVTDVEDTIENLLDEAGLDYEDCYAEDVDG